MDRFWTGTSDILKTQGCGWMAETDKNTRILELHTMLTRGECLRKKDLAQRFGVTEKSIQRDIEDLRDFFTRSGESRVLAYDAKERAYVLRADKALALTNSEVLAVAKILLESRSMVKDEMFPILDKLVRCCTPKESLKQVQSLIANEKFHYVEPHHGKAFVERLWALGTAVEKQQVLEIAYHRTHKNDTVTRRIQPVGILFSEYYFYLAAFIEGIDKQECFDNPEDKSPTIYRVDKIEKLKVTAEHFSVPYKDRFQEGEMRKRIQFMYGGELQRIRFAYTGPSIEAVLDRLPTAKIEKQTENGWICTAEVFGRGFELWANGQGEYIKIEKSSSIRNGGSVLK